MELWQAGGFYCDGIGVNSDELLALVRNAAKAKRECMPNYGSWLRVLAFHLGMEEWKADRFVDQHIRNRRDEKG